MWTLLNATPTMNWLILIKPFVAKKWRRKFVIDTKGKILLRIFVEFYTFSQYDNILSVK